MQSNANSMIESLVNVVVGIATSMLLQWTIYPLLEIPVTLPQNLIITSSFVALSFIRGYVIRRIFNRFG